MSTIYARLEDHIAALRAAGHRVDVRVGPMDEVTFTASLRVELDRRGIEAAVTAELLDRNDHLPVVGKFLRRLQYEQGIEV